MSALGIPDRTQYGDFSKIPVGVLLEYAVQRHKAEKAGEHDDLRIGDKSGLYSWAVPKGIPSPGNKALAIQQPLHSLDYADFQGRIESGYGKGDVELKARGKAMVLKRDKDKINYTTAHKRNQEFFSLILTAAPESARQWLLLNATPTKPAGDGKPHYKLRDWNKLKGKLDNYVGQPKADGASNLFRLNKEDVDVFSHRTSTGGFPIVHTTRFYGGPSTTDIPKELRGTTIRGEIIGFKRDKAIPPQELGGILNNTLANSLAEQQKRKIELKAMLYDVVGHTGDHSSRRRKLEEIQRVLGNKYFLPEEATTPEDITLLHNSIQSGEHPLTDEGIMLWPKSGGDPLKVKNTAEYDVVVRDILDGKNSIEGVGAGSFSYSHPGSDEVVGNIGTGLSRKLREDMLAAPKEYIGRVARVKAQKKMPSGALYAPSLLAFHEDY